LEIRHTGNLKIFSETASINESSAFGTTTNTDDINTLLNTNFQKGWENGVDEDGFPLRKWFNGKDKALTKLIAYLYQQGTPAYDSTQKYYVDSVCTYNGKAYISLTGTESTPNVGNIPTSSIGTSWNILNINYLSGAISNILTSNLTANRALISDSNGKITVSGITSTILGYLGNVSSDIQTQLNGKLGVNGTAVNADKLIGKNWYWNGQGGQPAWLWGGSDGVNMYVYNPSEFVVANISTPSVGYKNVGVWGADSIVATGAILVNSAYIAQNANHVSTQGVREANAGLYIGELGTTSLMVYPANNVTIEEGMLIAGSNLRYSGYNPYADNSGGVYGSSQGSSPTGTWRAMGYCVGKTDRYSATLFLRIA